MLYSIVITCMYVVAQSLRGLDFSIKDKFLAERLLGMEFHDTENKSILYRGTSAIVKEPK